MEMQFKRFCQAIKEAGYNPLPYIGKGMGDVDCVGIRVSTEVIPSNIVLYIVQCYTGKHKEEASVTRDVYNLCEDLRHSKMDQFGKGAVLYWPGVAWESDSDTEEDGPID